MTPYDGRRAGDGDTALSLLILAKVKVIIYSAAMAWEFSQDHGKLGINSGFREFSKKCWKFGYIQKIS